MTINVAGHLYNDAGTAISGASVKLLETGTTTQEGSTVTTGSGGEWAFTEADQDRYDVEITSGSSVRRIRWDDQISLKELDARNNTGATTPAATFSNITNAVANQVAVFSGANSTKADNDEIYLSYKLADSAGNLDEFARMTVVATDVTSGSEDGQIEFDVIKAGTLTKVWTITSSTGAAMSFDMNVDALTIGSGADTDVSLTFDANSADGVITWMEDEDYFKFSDDILMNSTERINFYDTAIYIYSSADGQLDLVADTEVQIAATTIDINGAVALNGAITGATDITLSGELDAATLDISGNADIDGTTNLDAVDIDGNVQLDGTLTVGVDDTGLDVKFFGATAGRFMLWDESDDALELTDSSPIKIGDGGDMTIYHDGSHSYITNATGALKLATETSGIAVTIGHATSEVTIADNLTVTGTLTLGSGAELAEAELELLDGITAGTAIASKVVTTDANIDTSGQRNLTITGELDAATLDISGNSDFDGTLDVAGNTVISAGTFTVGSDGSGQDVIFYSGTSGDNLTWDSSEEVLQITGTNGATALDVLDGDVRIVDKLYFFDRGGEYISSDGGTLTIKGASTIVDSTGGNFYVRAAGGGLILQSAENIFFDASQYFTWRDQDNSDNEILKLNSATATVALEFQQASTISTSTGILSLDAGSTSIRLNEAGADIDVFIESANNNKVFHTNAGTDTVGIGGTGVTESMLAIVAGAVGHNLYTQYGVAINVFADTFNDTGSAATDAIIPTVSIAPLTYTGTNANTYTNAVSLYIQGPPVASTNITITNAYALWVDAGVSRLDGAISLGTDHGDDGQQLTSGGDDAACDWTAASSLREHKNIGSEADAGQALQAMLDATPYHFRYKEKHGTGDSRTEYIGVMADDAPWAMHYKGTIVNPVNTLGYTVLAVQALNDKIERLESLLAKEA